jgi:S-adenosylmethionine synthetase
MVDTFGTGQVSDTAITTAVRDVFDLTPAGIITALDLRKPIFSATSSYGHFGRSPEKIGHGKRSMTKFSWERTDKVGDLRRAVR